MRTNSGRSHNAPQDGWRDHPHRRLTRHPQSGQHEGDIVKRTDRVQEARTRIVDYSAARARAIEWLGDRYLLARPINAGRGAWGGGAGTLPRPEPGVGGTAERLVAPAGASHPAR